MQFRKVFVVLATMAAMATQLTASSKFVFETFHNNSEARTLSFGLQDDENLSAFPPTMEAAVKSAYLLGGVGDGNASDYQKLGTQILAAENHANSATWTLVAENADISITFKLVADSGTPADTDILQIVAEGDDDFETTAIADGVTINVKAGNRYFIQYATSEDNIVPAAPENIEAQMLRNSKATDTITLDDDIPEGWELALIGAPAAYDANGNDIADSGIALGAITDGKVAVTLGENVESLALLVFQYAFQKGDATSLPAVVIITFFNGIATELETENFFMVEPKNDEPAKVDIRYTLDIHGDYQDKAATLKLSFPSWTTQDENPFPYAATVKLDDAEITKTDASAAHEPEYAFTLPADAEGTLEIDLTVAAKAESGLVYASIVVGEDEYALAPVRIIIKGTGTLDFDGDGEITLNDAMLLYNFVRRGYPDADDRRFTDSIKLAFTEGTTIEQANAAMDYFRANGNSLNLLGNENGLPNMNDVMLIYNFVRRGCPDEDDRRFTDTIKLAFTSDLTIEDANEAYKIIRSFAENVK